MVENAIQSLLACNLRYSPQMCIDEAAARAAPPHSTLPPRWAPCIGILHMQLLSEDPWRGWLLDPGKCRWLFICKGSQHESSKLHCCDDENQCEHLAHQAWTGSTTNRHAALQSMRAHRFRVAADGIGLPGGIGARGVGLVQAGSALGVKSSDEGGDAKGPHSSALCVLLLHPCSTTRTVARSWSGKLADARTTELQI